jgi:hypothetical protein
VQPERVNAAATAALAAIKRNKTFCTEDLSTGLFLSLQSMTFRGGDSRI